MTTPTTEQQVTEDVEYLTGLECIGSPVNPVYTHERTKAENDGHCFHCEDSNAKYPQFRLRCVPCLGKGKYSYKEAEFACHFCGGVDKGNWLIGLGSTPGRGYLLPSIRDIAAEACQIPKFKEWLKVQEEFNKPYIGLRKAIELLCSDPDTIHALAQMERGLEGRE